MATTPPDNMNQNRYEPVVGYESFPHIRFRCQECGGTSIGIGWETLTIVCDRCDEAMEYDDLLHDPKGLDEST